MTAPLRVLLLTPTALPNVTGNAVTAERWRRSLLRQGVAAEVLETQHLDAPGLRNVLDRFRPRVVHAHHISRAGALLLEPAVTDSLGEVPLVVSPAGTDLSLYARDAAGRDVIGRTCRAARSVIVQNPETARLLLRLLPDLEGRIAHAPKAFLWYGDDAFDLRAAAGCRPGDVLFFMPAGIRPVKGNLECLRAMEQVREARPSIRAVFAGPALEDGYSTRFAEAIRRREAFARWIPRIPPEAMCRAYGGADVVLNHSQSEGLSNSLLEAMAAGRPILASDIPGNRWLEERFDDDGPCACLFDLREPGDFTRKALRLATDPALRDSLSRAGRRRAAAGPTPGDEARALVGIYEAATGLRRSENPRLAPCGAVLHVGTDHSDSERTEHDEGARA